jgi:hypothetical protein
VNIPFIIDNPGVQGLDQKVINLTIQTSAAPFAAELANLNKKVRKHNPQQLSQNDAPSGAVRVGRTMRLHIF